MGSLSFLLRLFQRIPILFVKAGSVLGDPYPFVKAVLEDSYPLSKAGLGDSYPWFKVYICRSCPFC